MDGEYKEGWVLNIPADIAAYLREDEIASKVNKAVRERRVWLAAAAELRETEEVKRTGPASPAPCLQGRRKGEDVELCLPGTTREDREHREHSEFSDLSHLWGAYQPYGVAMEGAAAEGFAMGGTAKAVRRARRQGARPQAGARGEATRQERGGNGSADSGRSELAVADSGRSELATGAAGAECWLCGERGCDCEASMGEQHMDSSSAPVTPEQRSANMEQVTPGRADSSHSQQAFSLGPAAKEEGVCRVRRQLIIASERGTQTAEGPTADRERTANTAETDEIQELKALVEELQAQVLSAGRLAGMVAGWTVASPEVTVQRHGAVQGGGAAAAAGYVRPEYGPVPRLWKKADSLAAAAREATAEAEAVEAAEQMKVRAGERIAVKRQIWTKKRMENGKAAKKAVASKKSTATVTTSTSVEERRAAVDRISKQIDVKHSEDRNSTVTSCELEKYRTKNRPWD